METGFILTSIFEIAIVAFIIYALINEEKFAACERRVFRFINKKIKQFIYGSPVSSERI